MDKFGVAIAVCATADARPPPPPPMLLSFIQENPALLLVDTILGLTLNAVELFIAIT